VLQATIYCSHARQPEPFRSELLGQVCWELPDFLTIVAGREEETNKQTEKYKQKAWVGGMVRDKVRDEDKRLPQVA
jgi:hypothetical protein